MLSTDVVVFARDALGQLAFPLRGVAGLDAVVIGARTRLLLFAGEWFLNLSVGVRYLPTEDGFVTEDQALLGQPYNELKTRAEFLRELLTTPGIVDVPIFRCSFDPSTRTLTVVWQARTLFGDTPVDTLTRVF